MIFSKDYSDDQLPYTHSDRFLYARVLISSLFLCLSIFLTFIGKDTIIGPLVLFIGIVWNLFLPLNNWYGLFVSIMMSIVYALICVSIGLVANAFLYIAYYVPMQYMAIKNEGDSFILKDKKLSDKEGLFILFYYVLFFVGIYVFSSAITSSPLLCLIDSVSASLLALSALVRNLRLGSYFKVRFAALAVSILLWAMIATSEIRFSGATSVLLMYIMYFVYEIAVCIYQHRHYSNKQLIEEAEKKEESNKKLAEKKKQQLKENSK